MLRPTKTLVGCLTIAAALLAGVTTTSANNLSQSSRTFRGTWAPLEIIDLEVATVRCSVTVEGSFHSSTIRKVPGSLVGYITRAALSPCTGGNATFLRDTLPWHLQYEGFEGTLPAITGLQHGIIGFAMAVDPAGELLTMCLGRSEIPIIPILLIGGSFVAGVWVVAWIASYMAENRRISCGLGEINMIGRRGPLTVLNSTTLISIRLI